jgi:type IV pilus assembly protein PilC
MENEKKKRAEDLISAETNAVFCNQVAMFLKAGISLHDGMEAICDTYKDTRYKERFAQLASLAHESGSLYISIKDMGLFPAYMIGMIGIGERAGILEYVMKALGEHYNRESHLRHEIRSAVAYPLVLITIMAVVIAILSINVLPIFAQVYDSLGTQMTFSAQAIMKYGVTTGRIVMMLVVLILTVVLCVFILLRTRFKDTVFTFLARIFPAIGHISGLLSAARFSSVLARLIEGGFPMDEAMSMAISVLPSKAVADKLRVCRKDIVNGMSFAGAVEKAGIYTSIHNGMLRVAGLSGKLDGTLELIGKIYNEDADDRIHNLVAVIEPTMVGILCVVIGAILLSVMMPLASILSSLA